MKIISGHFKGRNFYMPAHIRPTQNVVRKAVFDLLGNDLSGVECLELFAGSGAVGLEALSLGAARVTFVEKDQKCLDVLMSNLALLGIGEEGERGRAEVISMDAMAAVKYFASRDRHFDLIFLDPPYGRGAVKKILKTLGAYDIVHPDCLVVVQHAKREAVPPQEGRLKLIRHRTYGTSHLSIFQTLKN